MIDRPGLAKAKPRKPALAPWELAADLATAKALDSWMRARGVSNTELADAMDFSEVIIRDWRTGERPINMRRLMLLPPRWRTSLFDALGAATMTVAA
jgi:hypothetical protein